LSQNRKKASELSQERQYAFARKVSFEEAFPEIDDVVVEVEEKGTVFTQALTRVDTQENHSENTSTAAIRCATMEAFQSAGFCAKW